MNWEAVSAIGQICGVLMTLIVGCIALLPYMRKCKVYFSFMYNTKKKPTFVAVNNSQKGLFINRILLYSGKWDSKPFCTIEMFDIEDDLLSEDVDFFVPPNDYIKFGVNADRVMHYFNHDDMTLFKRKNVYIALDFGGKLSKKYNTKIMTYEFVNTLKNESNSYTHLDIDKLFTWR